LTTPFLRAGYQATNIVFALLPLIYAAAALKGSHLWNCISLSCAY